MKVKFLKKGVFTSVGKTKIDVIQDLPADEANDFMQKGWAAPGEDMVPVSEDVTEPDELGERSEEDDIDPPEEESDNETSE